MTLKVVRLEVKSYDLDHLDLFWEIDDTNERLERWEFYILRSEEGPGGPFDSVIGPLAGNDLRFRDVERRALNNWRSTFYKLRAVNKDTAQSLEFGPATLEAPPDLIALELRRRMQVLTTEYAGRICLVYPAILSGFRCQTCFDASPQGYSIKRRTNQNCVTCFDTTFVGGFGKPLVSRIQIDPSAKNVHRTDTKETTPQDTSARLSAFPPLKPKDMIIEAENVRWEVQSVGQTEKLRAVVHQEVRLHRIPRSDIRYEVPVDETALGNAGPKREFTRPMNLQTAQERRESPLFDLLDGMLED